MGVAGHPSSAMGVALATPKDRLGVAKATWGVAGHPLGPKKKKIDGHVGGRFTLSGTNHSLRRPRNLWPVRFRWLAQVHHDCLPKCRPCFEGALCSQLRRRSEAVPQVLQILSGREEIGRR
jgi:hypothetical protein